MKLTIGPEATTLLIKVDGKALSEKASLMLPGATQSLTAKESIEITASNAGSVKVELNGKNLGLLGKDGQEVKDRKFTGS